MKVNFSIPLNKFGEGGVIYSKDAVEKAVKEYKKRINEKRSLGEFGPRSCTTVELGNVSHIVTDVETTDDGIKGELEVITSNGYDTQGVISTRGDQLAAMIEGSNLKVEPFIINGEIVSFDIVR